MIDSIEKLYDHANRYRPTVRVDGGEEGSLVVSMKRPNLFFNQSRLTSLDGLEVEVDGGWVPLAEFDEAARERRIERFEALYSFEQAIIAVEREERRLHKAWDELFPEDRSSFPLPEFPAIAARPTDEYREQVLAEERAK